MKSSQSNPRTVPRRFGSRPKCLIFDLDGTLVDSFADIAKALNLTRAHFGLPALSQAEVTRHVGSGSAYLVTALVPVPEREGAEAYRIYLVRFGNMPWIKPAYIRELRMFCVNTPSDAWPWLPTSRKRLPSLC